MGNWTMRHLDWPVERLRTPWACCALMGILALGGCGSPPQVFHEEQTYKTIDALWTALSTKRSDLLEATAADLNRLNAEGKLSPEGLAALSPILEKARRSEWQPAMVDLKAFIQGQRREQR